MTLCTRRGIARSMPTTAVNNTNERTDFFQYGLRKRVSLKTWFMA